MEEASLGFECTIEFEMLLSLLDLNVTLE